MTSLSSALPCLCAALPGHPAPGSWHLSSSGAGFGWYQIYLLIGGTALFLLGVQMASDGMRRAAGGRMRALFGTMAGSRAAGMGAGFTITAMLQSSSASTVVLVGMADAGLLSAVQSSSMILGADVGTTIVPQILAFKVARWGLLFVAAGFAVRLLARWQVWKSVGSAVVGFGLLFYGMHVMGLAVEPIRNDAGTAETLRSLAGNPWLAFLGAMVLTGIIQSSGATVALAMTLAAQETSPGVPVLPLNAALPVVVGANVGTCVTAMIAAVGAGREGRKVAATHLGFKLLAAIMVMPLIAWLNLGGAVTAIFQKMGAGPERAVANSHTLFNVAMAAAFLPFCTQLSALLGRLVPHRPTAAEKAARGLSRRLSAEPAAAIMAAEHALVDMGRRCSAMLGGALEVLERGGAVRIEEVRRRDDEVDAIYTGLSDYLSRLAHGGLSRGQAARQSRVLYLAKLFEEIGDLVSRELTKLAAKREKNDVSFSMESLAALRRFGADAVSDLERVAAGADREGATEVAEVVGSPQLIDEEARKLLADHFEQVCRGVAAAEESGSIYPDAVAALRDVRRTVAEIARVLALRPGESEAGA
ncbi:MAG: Na/Pi cotransporter family protein [Planctomycetota bacterium]|jgi:phosphate:Na+ symporter